MSDIEITMEAGTQKRLLTAGKYCDRNILVTAEKQSGADIPNPPEDGKTRLYITIPENVMEGWPPARRDLPLYFGQTAEHGVSIDWGDGSEPESLPGTGIVHATHTYMVGGEYVIVLAVTQGCEMSFVYGESYNGFYRILGMTFMSGYSETGYYSFMLNHLVIGDRINIEEHSLEELEGLVSVQIRGDVSNISNITFCNCVRLTNVVLPKNMTSLGQYAFNGCFDLTHITLPESLVTMGEEMFSGCSNLCAVQIPVGVTAIGGRTFSGCNSLVYVQIPEGVVELGEKAFSLCYSLISLKLPSTLINVGEEAFNNCFNMKEYHFMSKRPPTLNGSDVFYNMSPDCIIYVPTGCAEAYKTAEYWSEVASHIQEESTD